MLSGGELPALVIVDAVARLIPGVVGDEDSVAGDSFSRGLLDYPHYTRPAEFRDLKVPDVLVSGHHGEIRKWRKRQALELTLSGGRICWPTPSWTWKSRKSCES